MALIIIFLPVLLLLDHYFPDIFLFATFLLIILTLNFVIIGKKTHYFTTFILVCLICAKLIISEKQKILVEAAPVTAEVVGEIISIPQYQRRHVEFDFRVKDFHHRGIYKVSWYGITPDLHVHDTWRMTLKFKKGSFAYVTYEGPSVLLNRPHAWQSIDVMREQLAATIYRAMKISERQLGAILVALSTGSRHLIDQDTWKIFQNTGTSHLIAISGLHVGLVASLIFFMAGLISRFFIREGSISRPQVAWAISLLGATLYALFAGMGVSTQRAILMLSVLMLARLSYRHIPFWMILLLAFSIILYFMPLSAESISFWLSFGAVAMLAYVTHARLATQKGLKTWLFLQFQLFFGLLPLTLLFFSRVSLTMVVANYIAIPYISFVIVPLCLFSSVMHGVLPLLDAFMWGATAKLLWPLWWFLTKLACLPSSVWSHPITFMQFIFLMISVLLLLAPRGWYGRKFALVCCLPVFIPATHQPITLRVNKLSSDLVIAISDAGASMSIVSASRASVLPLISHTKLVVDLGQLTMPTTYAWHGVTVIAYPGEASIHTVNDEIKVMTGLTRARLEKYLAKVVAPPNVFIFSAKKPIVAALARQLHYAMPKTVILTNNYRGGCWLSNIPTQGALYSTVRNGSMILPL